MIAVEVYVADAEKSQSFFERFLDSLWFVQFLVKNDNVLAGL